MGFFYTVCASADVSVVSWTYRKQETDTREERCEECPLQMNAVWC